MAVYGIEEGEKWRNKRCQRTRKQRLYTGRHYRQRLGIEVINDYTLLPTLDTGFFKRGLNPPLEYHESARLMCSGR